MEPEKTLYEVLGETRIRQLVDHFYDYMNVLPEASVIRDMHPQDLTHTRDKLFWFLVGWSGGPDLYAQRYGHPRLRMRHFPYAIDKAAAQAWMTCMKKALDVVVTEPHQRSLLESTFGRIANHMRNVEEAD